MASERVLTAFASLKSDERLREILAWVKESRDDLRAKDMIENEVRVRWMQGGAQQLTDFLDTADKASESLKAIQAGNDKERLAAESE